MGAAEVGGRAACVRVWHAMCDVVWSGGGVVVRRGGGGGRKRVCVGGVRLHTSSCRLPHVVGCQRDCSHAGIVQPVQYCNNSINIL